MGGIRARYPVFNFCRTTRLRPIHPSPSISSITAAAYTHPQPNHPFADNHMDKYDTEKLYYFKIYVMLFYLVKISEHLKAVLV